jgi:hypothetical protein
MLPHPYMHVHTGRLCRNAADSGQQGQQQRLQQQRQQLRIPCCLIDKCDHLL